jgi:hypothetical protein
MHLESSVVVSQTIDQVWAFFVDPANLPKWDRSVATVIPTSPDIAGVGSTFDTIAPSGMRMSYRIIDIMPEQRASIRLVSSTMFKEALWTFIFEPVADEVRIICQVDLSPRLRYSFLIPVLLFTYKHAFRRDLTCLKQALENYEAEKAV